MQAPVDDKDFLAYYEHPELSGLLPVLYPGVFPHLARLTAPTGTTSWRSSSTGIPSGHHPRLPELDRVRATTTCSASTWPIKPSSKPSLLGILGGDLAGFPNGRRVFDDVVSIELRALAGLTYPLVDPSYKPDKAAGEIYDLENPATTDVGSAEVDRRELPVGLPVPRRAAQRILDPVQDP